MTNVGFDWLSKVKRVLSSVGRAVPLQGIGREFEPLSTHQTVEPEKVLGVVVQLVRISACHAGGRGFESRPLRQKLEKANICSPFFIDSESFLMGYNRHA